MKRLTIAIACALASTAAFGFENPDYHFKVVVQSGQTVDGYQLAAFTPPAINNLDRVIFGATAALPNLPNNTFFAGLFSPQKRISAYTAPTDSPCLGPYAINDKDQIAFVMNNKLSPTEPEVSAVYGTNYAGAPVQTLVPAGAVVDGVTLLGNFCGTENGNNFAFNNEGRVAFNDTGGSYRYVPRKGISKINPNQGDGRTITAVTNDAAPELVFNGVIGSTFPGVSNAIFTHRYTLLTVPATIDGVDATTIIETQVAADGQFVFLGNVGAPQAPSYGLFTRGHAIARDGVTIDGKTLITHASPFVGVPAINSRGEVAFVANTGLGIPSMFVGGHVLLSPGDTLNGRTVSSFSDPVMNDFGVIAFQVSFTDGSSAIMEATKRWR